MLANARMYSVTPAAAAAWRSVIEWAARKAGVPVEFVEHAPPKLLSDLWARDDFTAFFARNDTFALCIVHGAPCTDDCTPCTLHHAPCTDG